MYGFNQEKLQNPCHICDSSKCVQDCTGTYGGNATYGCDGVCNSKATCSLCGNGKIDPGEECDFGHDTSTCKNCQTVSGASTNPGTIIGAVIGAVACVAFLAAAAFLGYRYAKNAGLIGKAGKKIDFGASNTNPLYKGETAVHQNPLYSNH